MRVRHVVRSAPSLLLAALTLAGSASAPSAQERVAGVIPELAPAECVAGNTRVAVLLLGSYHMSNPGADRFNLEADDVLSPGRYEEMLRVVERFSSFAPTRVAIESPWGDTVTTARYRAYLAGEKELSRPAGGG